MQQSVASSGAQLSSGSRPRVDTETSVVMLPVNAYGTNCLGDRSDAECQAAATMATSVTR